MKKEILNKIEQEEVCNLYKNKNMSLHKIANLYSCSIKPIINTLDKNKIERRVHTRSEFDISYFSCINTSEKAYFLGLLMADGCNYRKGFTLSLQEGDCKIIEKFKESIKFTGNINYRKHTNPKYKGIVRIKIHSDTISSQLSNLGVIPNKSLCTKFPAIPEEFYSHFIRGVFDGDGCISIYKSSIYNTCEFSIIGNTDLIEKIQEILITNCNLNKTKIRKKNISSDRIVTLSYSGKKRVSKIFEWLYKDSNDFFIERKF